jgi:hypothetical protein
MDIDLTIPEFLRRPNETARRKSRVKARLTMPVPSHQKRPPKGWKKATRGIIRLEDECPRIGCGHRLVWAKIGTKWVHLSDCTGRRGRLPLEIFHRRKVSDFVGPQ